MKDDPVRIKDALSPLGRRLGLRSPAEAARVFSRWAEVVGTAVAEHANPSSLKGGVLRIAADSSTWATEITYLAEEIKARANEVAGADVVSEVRVWTGKGDAGPRQSGTSKPPPGASSPNPEGERATPSADSPEEALARARNAWSEARLRTGSRSVENRERRR